MNISIYMDYVPITELIRLLYYLPTEMLRKKKDNSEYEIDRELTGKFAIEKNFEYQEKIEELEEENKKLKEEKEIQKKLNLGERMAYLRCIEELKEENKKLKSDLEECECSFGFESDEVGYRKRECKKLKEELSKLKEKYGDIDY